jgi:hypothetical protein
MGREQNPSIDRRELELVTREAELNQRAARMRRIAEERADALDAREDELGRREAAIVTLARELAAERALLDAAHARLREELRPVEPVPAPARPRLVALPEPATRDRDPWANVLRR